jgi:hypothetical protein
MARDLPQPLLTPVQDRDIWRRARPAYQPEEGRADRSDWMSLVKAAALILVPLAMLALLLSR